jgi:hypothetical protein
LKDGSGGCKDLNADESDAADDNETAASGTDNCAGGGNHRRPAAVENGDDDDDDDDVAGSQMRICGWAVILLGVPLEDAKVDDAAADAE